jgi:hypothetical protein
MPASPSLLIVPARFKTGKLYTQIATTSAGVVLGSSGDFNVTRDTTATRFNSAGLIESVASGVPRLDYYTSGGTAGCPALLVEASGSNGILNSQDTATSWLLGANLSSGYVDVIGVSGNNLTIATSGSNLGSTNGVIRRASNNVALASGSTYTLSFLMKKTGAHTIGGYWAIITGAASGNLGGGFNVSGSFSSGVLYDTAGTTSRIRRVEQWGTDVYRCSETFTMTASGTLTQLSLAPVAGVTNVDNPATGAQLAFAAPQIELGAIPTSFIPTTAAAVTRNADVINLSGAVSGCIGQTEGTIYFEVEVTDEARDRWICTLDSAANSFIQIALNTNRAILVNSLNAGSTVISSLTSTALSVGYHKVAFAYNTAASGCIMYIDGAQNPVAVRTVTGSGLPALNNFSLGNFRTSVSDNLKARIRSAALYTTRLTNAELAALTTL